MIGDSLRSNAVVVADNAAVAADDAIDDDVEQQQQQRVGAVEKRPGLDAILGLLVDFSRISPCRGCSATHTHLNQPAFFSLFMRDSFFVKIENKRSIQFLIS